MLGTSAAEATSSPDSLWMGMQIRPAMLPRLQKSSPNNSTSSGPRPRPSRYGCAGSGFSVGMSPLETSITLCLPRQRFVLAPAGEQRDAGHKTAGICADAILDSVQVTPVRSSAITGQNRGTRTMSGYASDAAKVPWWKEPTKDQWYAYIAAWLGWTLDAFDFTVFLLIMAPIAQEFGVPIIEVTAVFSV